MYAKFQNQGVDFPEVDEMEKFECHLYKTHPTVTYGAFLRTFDVQYSKCPSPIASLAFNRDGRLLAVGSSCSFEEGEES